MFPGAAVDPDGVEHVIDDAAVDGGRAPPRVDADRGCW